MEIASLVEVGSAADAVCADWHPNAKKRGSNASAARAGPLPSPKAGPPPLAEGKRLFDREGRLDFDDEGQPTFVFDSGDVPVRLLESAWREFLESVTDDGKKHARWRVSGIVTLYQNRNYLLLTKVVRIMPEEEDL